MDNPITDDILETRSGVLRYPNQAAAKLIDTPPSPTEPHLANPTLQTREGVLRFPQKVAELIAGVVPSVWILSTGFWVDAAHWNDTQVWIDSL